MNRIVNSLGHRLKPFFFKKYKTLVENNFKRIDAIHLPKDKVAPFHKIEGIDDFVFKDNSWNHIKYIDRFMWNELYLSKIMRENNQTFFEDNDCDNTNVNFRNEEMICHGNGHKNDWLFLQNNQHLDFDYVLKFDTNIKTENSEFQIAFNYKDIGNRYRFNFRNNSTLSFEVVNRGFFFNDICTVPFSINLGEDYNFEIIVCDGCFEYKVNGQTVMAVQETKNLLDGNKFAFILWDSTGNPIDVSYKNIEVFKIELGTVELT